MKWKVPFKWPAIFHCPLMVLGMLDFGGCWNNGVVCVAMNSYECKVYAGMHDMCAGIDRYCRIELKIFRTPMFSIFSVFSFFLPIACSISDYDWLWLKNNFYLHTVKFGWLQQTHKKTGCDWFNLYNPIMPHSNRNIYKKWLQCY